MTSSVQGCISWSFIIHFVSYIIFLASYADDLWARHALLRGTRDEPKECARTRSQLSSWFQIKTMLIKAAYDFAVLTWQQLSSFKRLGFSSCNVAGKTFFIDLLPLSREFWARRTCINNHPTLTNALLFTSAILILAPTVPWGLGRSQTEHVKLILQWPGCREKKWR